MKTFDICIASILFLALLPCLVLIGVVGLGIRSVAWMGAYGDNPEYFWRNSEDADRQ